MEILKNYRTENYSNMKDTCLISLIVVWMTEGGINELDQWSNEFNLNNKEKIDWEKSKQRLRDMQDTGKISSDYIITERVGLKIYSTK